MTYDAETWLLVAAARAGARGGAAAVPVVRFRDLQPRQKRELSALTGAGLCLSILLLVPAILPVAEDDLLAASEVRVHVAAAPVPPATVPVERATQPIRARDLPQPQVVSARAVLIPARPLQASLDAPVARAEVLDTAVRPSTGRGGPVLRVLVGDGRYRVRPFPTPAGRNSSADVHNP